MVALRPVTPFPPPEPILYASNYFEQLYQWAEYLVERGLAYVDDQDGETISAQRGGYGKPGIESPFRERSVDENLRIFRAMRAGELPDGTPVPLLGVLAARLSLRSLPLPLPFSAASPRSTSPRLASHQAGL